MPALELLYFPGCPHVEAARAHLATACRQLNHTTVWTEWDTSAAATPAHRRHFASPTILVNGTPVGNGGPAAERCCVISGSPSVEQLIAALAMER